MKKYLFFSLSLLGLAIIILTLFVFKFDGSLGLSLIISGVFAFIGGLVGAACVSENGIKGVFELFMAFLDQL